MTSDPPYRRAPDAHHPWQTAGMPMRQDCKFFESRTYANGETVRKCDLDLAPEAPWRCPDDCTAYTRRLADVNWKHGSLITPATPEEPPGLDDRGDEIASLLDEAEDIINAAGPRIMAEVDAERARASKPGVAGRLGRIFRRKPKG
jgi:hypothetical protein